MMVTVLEILIVLAVPAQGLEGGLRAAHHRLQSKSMTIASDKHSTNHTEHGVSVASFMGSSTIPDKAVQQAIVDAHNLFRCSMCDTPPMTWDDAIAKDAMDYMNTGASHGHCPSYDGTIPGCVGHGENLFSAAAGEDSGTWQRAVNAWFASEIDCYNFDTGSSKCTAGHFTQVAWDTSTEVGCASNPSATGGYKTLCMYGKPANIIGQYTKHVHKCPTAKHFQYFTGAASCCNGPKTVCHQGHCGWEYETKQTVTGCPAGSCSIHASCAAVTTTTTPAPTMAPTAAAQSAQTSTVTSKFSMWAAVGNTMAHASGGSYQWNRLSTWYCPGYANCEWQLEPSPTRPGMVYIKASDRATYMSVLGGTNSGNALAMDACPKANDYPNCQWALEKSTTRPGLYYIRASDQSTYMHASGSTAAGSPLTMYTCHKGYDYPNCQWYIPDGVMSELR